MCPCPPVEVVEGEPQSVPRGTFAFGVPGDVQPSPWSQCPGCLACAHSGKRERFVFTGDLVCKHFPCHAASALVALLKSEPQPLVPPGWTQGQGRGKGLQDLGLGDLEEGVLLWRAEVARGSVGLQAEGAATFLDIQTPGAEPEPVNGVMLWPWQSRGLRITCADTSGWYLRSSRTASIEPWGEEPKGSGDTGLGKAGGGGEREEARREAVEESNPLGSGKSRRGARSCRSPYGRQPQPSAGSQNVEIRASVILGMPGLGRLPRRQAGQELDMGLSSGSSKGQKSQRIRVIRIVERSQKRWGAFWTSGKVKGRTWPGKGVGLLESGPRKFWSVVRRHYILRVRWEAVMSDGEVLAVARRDRGACVGSQVCRGEKDPAGPAVPRTHAAMVGGWVARGWSCLCLFPKW
ncbi:LOW QUALITY PROTEIN: hypothetical protein AAY473_011394 [Plecturocebus cupreus]